MRVTIHWQGKHSNLETTSNNFIQTKYTKKLELSLCQVFFYQAQHQHGEIRLFQSHSSEILSYAAPISTSLQQLQEWQLWQLNQWRDVTPNNELGPDSI